MFDIGFAELLVILVLGLLVLGPERLQRSAKMAGLMLGKARAAVADMQREIEQGVPVEEMKGQVQEVERQVAKLRPSNVRRRSAPANPPQEGKSDA